MTAPNIILVEDDPHLRTLTARALRENGYVVRPAVSAPEMWLAFEQGPVDLLLLDIMLPRTSGIDLCREIRRTSDVPIIFISAKGSETDRVVGLELGADDYLAKPFGTRELIARVRAAQSLICSSAYVTMPSVSSRANDLSSCPARALAIVRTAASMC